MSSGSLRNLLIMNLKKTKTALRKFFKKTNKACTPLKMTITIRQVAVLILQELEGRTLILWLNTDRSLKSLRVKINRNFLGTRQTLPKIVEPHLKTTLAQKTFSIRSQLDLACKFQIIYKCQT